MRRPRLSGRATARANVSASHPPRRRQALPPGPRPKARPTNQLTDNELISEAARTPTKQTSTSGGASGLRYYTAQDSGKWPIWRQPSLSGVHVANGVQVSSFNYTLSTCYCRPSSSGKHAAVFRYIDIRTSGAPPDWHLQGVSMCYVTYKLPSPPYARHMWSYTGLT